MKNKNLISANICRFTMRGVGDRPASNSWFPLWMLNRYLEFSWDKNPDFLFYGDINKEAIFNSSSKSIRIFLTGENIQPNWNETDYALTHEREYSERHWRVPLWRHFYDPGHTKLKREFTEVKKRANRFCNFIYSNENAKERIDFFHLLNQYKHVDSGGKVLNNIGGRVKDKLEMVSKSKFTIAFENESHPGYATEKIIEPLIQGSIPIYWGDPTITKDFNPECLINVHDFNSFEEVVERVIEIDNNDDLWKSYIKAPIFKDNKLPEELTNEAILEFFDKIFSKKKAYVLKPRKQVQKLNYIIKAKLKKDSNLFSRIKNRLRVECINLKSKDNT